MKTNNLLSKGLAPNLNVEWVSGKDEFIKIKGHEQEIIDFTSGILVNCLGYNNQLLINNLNNIISKGILHSYHYQTEIKESYLNSLKEFTSEIFDDPKFYLTSSGTEATETCLKLILRSGLNHSEERNKILTIEGNYHGRTMGAALMGNGNIYKNIYSELNDYFPKVNFPYIWEVEEKDGETFFLQQLNAIPKAIRDSICGILIETYQGWGACSYPMSFIKAIEKFCLEEKIVLAFDEMQAGFYRTGKKFGFQHYDVNPDLICIGKGMGAGLPLSGIIGKNEIMDLALEGELSSTHSCNPISCAAGNTVIEVMQSSEFKSNLKSNVNLFNFRGKALIEKFSFLRKKSNFIGMVGALVFDFKENKKGVEMANRFCDEALKSGVLVIKTGREAVKLSPSLLIKEVSVNKVFDVFEKILNKFNEIL